MHQPVPKATEVSLKPKWYTVEQVAHLSNYGQSKVRMLTIQGRSALIEGRAVPANPPGVGGRVRGSQSR